MVCARSVLKNACAVGNSNSLALPCSTAPIEILLIRVSARKREIDVVDDVCVMGARLARRARHQPFGERRNRRGMLVIEQDAMAVEGLHRAIGGGGFGTCWALG